MDTDCKNSDYYYYESKFLENGGNHSGYLLKPAFMLESYESIVCPTLDF